MVNIPVLAVALTAGARLVLESRDPAPGRFDLVGAPASWPATPAGRRAACQARNPSRDTAVATWCELLKLPANHTQVVDQQSRSCRAADPRRVVTRGQLLPGAGKARIGP